MSDARSGADDRLAVIETCTRFHWLYDQRAWGAIGELLEEVVSFPTLEEVRGDPAFDPDTYLGGFRRSRSKVIQGLQLAATGTITQHLIAGHQVTVASDAATCLAQGINVHLQAGVESAPLWHGNTYRFDLVRTPLRWTIAGMVATVLWSSGNESVHDAGAKQHQWLQMDNG